jgi:putative PIN family toxin of toxin-antitoxin system
MPSAVVDSTVLVSAFLTPGGVSAELLQSARRGAFVCCLAQEILDEAERVLRSPRLRRHHPYTDHDVTEFVGGLRRAANRINNLPHLTGIVRDPNDDMVIATALKAQASYIITRDDDLLSLGTYEDITIITPEAFMGLLREQGRVQ